MAAGIPGWTGSNAVAGRKSGVNSSLRMEALTRAGSGAASAARCSIEAREAIWGKLAAKGLVWQPGRGAGEERQLVLSSPREWTAEQWKDAALHVLEMEAELRASGWTLGAAAPQWVQFAGCRPVWISQTALHPARAGVWEARRQFEKEFLGPLLERCGVRRGWIDWLGALGRMRPRLAGRSLPAADELERLHERLERLAPRRRWSPWKCAESAREPSGLASVLVREAAARLGARLVYEWRGKAPMSEALRAVSGVAWVRFHESEEEAAADYLGQRAVHGGVLPLWSRGGDPMQECPQRIAAHLAVAVGRGNVPRTLPELARFAGHLSRMAPVALVEFVPERDGMDWDCFLAVIREHFRVEWVAETGAERRLCTLVRAGQP